MLAFDAIEPEPSADYALAAILSQLHNLLSSSGKRTTPADYSLAPKPPKPRQTTAEMRAIFEHFATQFNALPQKGIK